jgi:hypothetical protein
MPFSGKLGRESIRCCNGELPSPIGGARPNLSQVHPLSKVLHRSELNSGSNFPGAAPPAYRV